MAPLQNGNIIEWHHYRKVQSQNGNITEWHHYRMVNLQNGTITERHSTEWQHHRMATSQNGNITECYQSGRLFLFFSFSANPDITVKWACTVARIGVRELRPNINNNSNHHHHHVREGLGAFPVP